MDVRNCIRCGKIFKFIANPICPACMKQEEMEYEAVRDYVREHKGCTIAEVSQETGVSPKKIKQFLQEGLLEAIGAEGYNLLTCEKCGKSIPKDKYCDACKKELMRELKTAANKSHLSVGTKAKKAKMHLSKFRDN